MPARVVSLVPSVTESLSAWGLTPVACTRFCERPDLRHVGGTKDPNVAAIVDLAPDLVVMCDEENRLDDARAIAAAGITVHDCSPRSVADVAPAMAALAAAAGLVATSVGDGLVQDPTATLGPPLGLRAFVPIWRRPWMTLAADTYGSSVLEAIGVTNVFDDDDRRYPEVSLDAAEAAAADVVILPSEPYPFKARHHDELARVGRVVPVDGRDLFWWGVRTPSALARLRAVLAVLAG